MTTKHLIAKKGARASGRSGVQLPKPRPTLQTQTGLHSLAKSHSLLANPKKTSQRPAPPMSLMSKDVHEAAPDQESGARVFRQNRGGGLPILPKPTLGPSSTLTCKNVLHSCLHSYPETLPQTGWSESTQRSRQVNEVQEAPDRGGEGARASGRSGVPLPHPKPTRKKSCTPRSYCTCLSALLPTIPCYHSEGPTHKRHLNYIQHVPSLSCANKQCLPSLVSILMSACCCCFLAVCC